MGDQENQSRERVRIWGNCEVMSILCFCQWLSFWTCTGLVFLSLLRIVHRVLIASKIYSYCIVPVASSLTGSSWETSVMISASMTWSKRLGRGHGFPTDYFGLSDLLRCGKNNHLNRKPNASLPAPSGGCRQPDWTCVVRWWYHSKLNPILCLRWCQQREGSQLDHSWSVADKHFWGCTWDRLRSSPISSVATYGTRTYVRKYG